MRFVPPHWLQSALLVTLWSAFGYLILSASVMLAVLGALGLAAGALATSQYLYLGHPNPLAPLIVGLLFLVACSAAAAWLAAAPLYRLRCWLLRTPAQPSRLHRPQAICLAWLAVVAPALVVLSLAGLAALAGAGLIILLTTLLAGRALVEYERKTARRITLRQILHEASGEPAPPPDDAAQGSGG